MNKIFGYNWEDIKAMQSGTHKPKIVAPKAKPQATDADKSLLEKYGIKKLEEFGYFGVIDRLRNSGLVK